MTAGAASVGIAIENSFMNLPDIPEWFQPGENVTVSDATLDRSLTRARQPDDPRPDGSTEGNLLGSWGITFDVTDTNWHDMVFPATAPVGLARSAMSAPSATIYLAADLPGNTQERFLAGAVVDSVTLTYTENENVQLELSGSYYDEPQVGGTHGDAPGTIQQPTKSDIVRGHGFDLTLDSVQVSELQSASIEVGNMTLPRQQQENKPAGVDVGGYEPSASIEGNLIDDTQRLRAYGSDTATEPLEEVSEVDGQVTLDNPAGTLVTYNLNRMQHENYSWSELVSSESVVSEPITLQYADWQVA